MLAFVQFAPCSTLGTPKNDPNFPTDWICGEDPFYIPSLHSYDVHFYFLPVLEGPFMLVPLLHWLASSVTLILLFTACSIVVSALCAMACFFWNLIHTSCGFSVTLFSSPIFPFWFHCEHFIQLPWRYKWVVPLVFPNINLHFEWSNNPYTFHSEFEWIAWRSFCLLAC